MFNSVRESRYQKCFRTEEHIRRVVETNEQSWKNSGIIRIYLLIRRH